MSNKRRIVSVAWLLCVMIIISPIVSVVSEADTSSVSVPGLENFTKTSNYHDGQFTDVHSSDWFINDVKSVYEMGMMVGNSSSTFNPFGNVTIAEASTIAARLNKKYYTGSSVFQNGVIWYDPYIEYDLENGIIDKTLAAKPDNQATRAQFAAILSRALPDEVMTVLNTVDLSSIPDVTDSTLYGSEILKLYRTGVLIGSDEYGTFLPDTHIERCAVAAIVNRLTDPTQRKTYSPKIREITPAPTPTPTPQPTPTPTPTPQPTPTPTPTPQPTPTPTPDPQPEPVNPATYDYVLNVNTGKFHYPDCSSAKRIKAENRRDVTASREDLIAKGYEPCKNCNP